jgi:hypothetical protein
MISIFVMYSNDREIAFSRTCQCLEQMPLYAQAQKTLVVDGKLQKAWKDWEVVQVPRVGGKFCWARMWEAGVLTARNEAVLYLDSDRLLPSCLLKEVVTKLQDRVFLFTSNHYMMADPLTFELCNYFMDHWRDDELFYDQRFIGKLVYEPRFKDPVHGPGKNVMSGGTAFTRSTYLKIGGVDSWYCGHGAYADTDFHFQAAQAGCQFIDLGLPELHYPHDKREGETVLSRDQLNLLSLDNFIHYCKKWNLPSVLAESIAYKCKIKDYRRYVEERLG